MQLLRVIINMVSASETCCKFWLLNRTEGNSREKGELVFTLTSQTFLLSIALLFHSLCRAMGRAEIGSHVMSA